MVDWKPPRWINEITDLVDKAQVDRAAELLTDDLIQGHADNEVMPEKGHILVTSAKLLRRLSQVHRAEAFYKQLLALCPDNVPILNETANILEEQGKVHEAVGYLEKALEIAPDEPGLWHNLGANLIRLGQVGQGIQRLKDAAKKMPDNNQIWSTLLLNMHYDPQTERADFFEMAQSWANLNAPSCLAKTHFQNLLDSKRRLRIGYISPDFREHSVNYFFEPLLDVHNRDVVELYGYGLVEIPDSVTERLKGKFGHYVNLYGMDDKARAEAIQADEIDILVDLAGHMGGSGAYSLAFKPAPIQVTWLGYPDTTGLSQIDYRLTDATSDPPGSEAFYSEKLFHLPECFLCYGPGEVRPSVSKLPCEENGYVTFGSFNNSAKINDVTIEMWSKVLRATPDSKLLLKFKSGEHSEAQALFVKRFEAYGVEAHRLLFSGWLPSPAHMELYHQVDIALDTFPYNGTATTCQSLLMGVPVISLAGEHHMSRVGLSLLRNVGLEFFAASTHEEYVSKASAMAQQTESLSKIRASLRTRVATSVLCNNIGFARHIEQAYRSMWQTYCLNQKEESGECGSKRKPVHEKVPMSAECTGKAKRGVLFVIWGNNHDIERMLSRAIKSVEAHHPELPIHVERLETGSKVTKTKMFDMTPFEETLFLDNDTTVLGRLDFGFEKAAQFGLACTLNGCPLAKRYRDKRLTGDMIEYSSGVIFFTAKARPFFDAWADIFPTVDSSIFHYKGKELCLMPAADQASFALAVEQTGFLPFVLPHNWNLHPEWNKHFFGPVKIWHGDHDVPEHLYGWNEQQSQEDAIIQSAQIG